MNRTKHHRISISVEQATLDALKAKAEYEKRSLSNTAALCLTTAIAPTRFYPIRMGGAPLARKKDTEK